MQQKICLYSNRLVILSGEEQEYEGVLFLVAVAVADGSRIFVPKTRIREIVALASLIRSGSHLDDLVGILRQKDPKQPAELKKKNVTQDKIAAELVQTHDIDLWVKVLAYVWKRNHERLPGHDLVFTTVYDAVFQVFLHTCAAHWEVQPETACSRLEKLIGHSFAW